MADNMQELKEQKIWMLWRWETKPDGKRTKVPMSVSGGPCGTVPVQVCGCLAIDIIVCGIGSLAVQSE